MYLKIILASGGGGGGGGNELVFNFELFIGFGIKALICLELL